VKKLDYWKIAALIGTMVFLVSAFLPMTNVGVNLVDLYRIIVSIMAQGSTSTDVASLGALPADIYVAAIGILLTIVLWPIALILGFVSIAKRRVALAAGTVGLICWIGAIMFVAVLQSYFGSDLLQYGTGIFVGFAGAVILLVAYFLKPTPAPAPQAAYPPPPPQYAPTRRKD
jgi:hypothetical protein